MQIQFIHHYKKILCGRIKVENATFVYCSYTYSYSTARCEQCYTKAVIEPEAREQCYMKAVMEPEMRDQ